VTGHCEGDCQTDGEVSRLEVLSVELLREGEAEAEAKAEMEQVAWILVLMIAFIVAPLVLWSHRQRRARRGIASDSHTPDVVFILSSKILCCSASLNYMHSHVIVNMSVVEPNLRTLNAFLNYDEIGS
jgi:hypothetical protein